MPGKQPGKNCRSGNIRAPAGPGLRLVSAEIIDNSKGQLRERGGTPFARYLVAL